MLAISLSDTSNEDLHSYSRRQARLNQLRLLKIVRQVRFFSWLWLRRDVYKGRGAAAIQQFNGQETGRPSLNVNESKPREDRGGGVVVAVLAAVGAAWWWCGAGRLRRRRFALC